MATYDLGSILGRTSRTETEKRLGYIREQCVKRKEKLIFQVKTSALRDGASLKDCGIEDIRDTGLAAQVADDVFVIYGGKRRYLKRKNA